MVNGHSTVPPPCLCQNQHNTPTYSLTYSILVHEKIALCTICEGGTVLKTQLMLKTPLMSYVHKPKIVETVLCGIS